MTLASALPVPAKGRGAGVGQVLHVVPPQRVAGERGLHRVRSAAGLLRDHVAGDRDDVGVVAGAADQRVDPGAAAVVQRVVAGRRR